MVFSTHVMQHAERLCDQVVLIAAGRKVFDGTVAEACAAAPRTLVLEGALRGRRARPALPGVAGVTAEALEDGRCGSPPTLAPGAPVQAALKAAFARGLDITRFELKEPHLHDAFIVARPAAEAPAHEPGPCASPRANTWPTSARSASGCRSA